MSEHHLEMIGSSLYAGTGGGAGSNRSDANIGTTMAEIPDPTQPIGLRWSVVADSQIWRM